MPNSSPACSPLRQPPPSPNRPPPYYCPSPPPPASFIPHETITTIRHRAMPTEVPQQPGMAVGERQRGSELTLPHRVPSPSTGLARGDAGAGPRLRTSLVVDLSAPGIRSAGLGTGPV